jgi:hypothetical protein
MLLFYILLHYNYTTATTTTVVERQCFIKIKSNIFCINFVYYNVVEIQQVFAMIFTKLHKKQVVEISTFAQGLKINCI